MVLVTRERNLSYVWGKPFTEINDDWWLAEYEKLRKTPFPVAAVTVLSGECALQMRDSSGHITKLILTDRDPLIISVRTGQYELLSLVASYNDEQYLRSFGGDKITVHAFLEAKGDSAVTSEPDLWLNLSKLLGIQSLFISVQPDH